MASLNDSIAFSLFFLLIITNASGDEIRYDTMHNDGMQGFQCSREHPDRCYPPPSNVYWGACEEIEECRDGLREDFDGDTRKNFNRKMRLVHRTRW
ncbi:hypothetical protein RHMOL_Rhmol05G0193300 [Rhododendron molle]|uniref:Uncharacterized protein n=1 Tax=Rhododendron molle TaxID=49168 RepID=A0ACC0NT26_RHOML|nr:hypothetical protein RHMOL_Rhmol05G0193300 [Rhododendron molle]